MIQRFKYFIFKGTSDYTWLQSNFGWIQNRWKQAMANCPGDTGWYINKYLTKTSWCRCWAVEVTFFTIILRKKTAIHFFPGNMMVEGGRGNYLGHFCNIIENNCKWTLFNLLQSKMNFDWEVKLFFSGSLVKYLGKVPIDSRVFIPLLYFGMFGKV